MQNIFEQVITFWNSQGWLANALGVLIGLVTIISIGYAAFQKVRQKLSHSRSTGNYKNISDYVATRINSSSDVMAKIKQTSKIAIIDDHPDDFPVDYLRRAGFNVDVFSEFSFADTDRLQQYDVVLLDIVGVVTEDKRAGGLELIKRIKAMDKYPGLIAVSSKKFDPTVTDFFKLADDVMRKPISENACEEHLVEMLEQRFGLRPSNWRLIPPS